MTPQKLNKFFGDYEKEIKSTLFVALVLAYAALYGNVRSDTRRIDGIEQDYVKKDAFQQVKSTVERIDQKQDTLLFRQWQIGYELKQHMEKDRR